MTNLTLMSRCLLSEKAFTGHSSTAKCGGTKQYYRRGNKFDG